MASIRALGLAVLTIWMQLAWPAHSQTTTVPIFLPNYDPRWWRLVRGIVVAQNEVATTYSIFCPPEKPPKCDVALEFPFIFAEGPSTLQFSGTVTSTFINNLACQLAGTTAATCSGYSSLGSGIVLGVHTGPTEVSWHSTLTGSEVRWGVLTVVPSASTTDTPDIPATAMITDETTLPDGVVTTGTPRQNGMPRETGASAGAALRPSGGWMLGFAVGAAVALLGM